jgi:hypothetical protein
MRHFVSAPLDEPASEFVKRLPLDARLVSTGIMTGEKGSPLVFVEFTYKVGDESDVQIEETI